MRTGGGDLQAVLPRQFHDSAPQTHQLRAYFGWCLAHTGTDLDNRLVQFRLDLFAQDQPTLLQNLCDVGAEFPRLRINDLIFFLDADGK